MTGTLYSVGVGPGDPELLTLKAARILATAPAHAYFAKRGCLSHAHGIAAAHLRPGAEALRFDYPFTTEIPVTDPRYAGGMAVFYEAAAAAIAGRLEDGVSVALLCEGDPFFYGSAIYVFDRLSPRYRHEVVPGVPGMAGAWARAGTPMTHGDDVLTVLPGTLDLASLIARLRGSDAAVIMKVGRNLPKIRAALAEAGRSDRAVYVERATMAEERITRLADMPDAPAPYFSLILMPGPARRAMKGRLTIVGLGPGDTALLAPRAAEALADATDLVGYGPYLDRVPAQDGQVRHASDNRVELDRARHALTLATSGRRVAVVSGGDAGVFGMAAAVFEAVAAEPDHAGLDIAVVPGISALLAAAARLGAPLGHDFCAISLSDNLKPWPTVLHRLRTAAEAGFVLALYNPLSRARAWQLGAAFDSLRDVLPGGTPVAFATAISRPDEHVDVTTLDAADPARADMRTLVMVGSAATRTIARPDGGVWLYTPRSAA